MNRTELLIGKSATRKLAKARVLVFGLGGVGSYAVEGLARCGVGSFVLVDHDVVGATNLNRQLPALHSTLGRPKVDVMRERILDINPKASVETYPMFYRPENADAIPFEKADCIVDAIDTTRAKLDLVVKAHALGIPIISCMAMGNRLDPTQVKAGDLFDTEGCPLCRVMRKKLRTRHGITHLHAVYSTETPVDVQHIYDKDEHTTAKRPTPGSIAFVPSVAGMILASEVVKLVVSC